MFGLSFGEIAVIFILALVLLGPQKLPELARGIGKALREIRRAGDDLKETIEAEALRAEARELERRILSHNADLPVARPAARAPAPSPAPAAAAPKDATSPAPQEKP